MMFFPTLASASLSRRFAVAAAILSAAAVMLVSLTSVWLVDRQRASATELLQKREILFHAETVSNNLDALSERMIEVADSPILATGLVDSAGKETYLAPFLHGLRQINGIPVQLLFTDFEGKEIAGNDGPAFSADDMAWLRRQINQNRETSVIRDDPGGAQLIGVELLRYARTNSPEGALMYRVRLSSLKPAPSAEIVWGSDVRAAERDAMSVPIEVPPPLRHLGLRLVEDPRKLGAILEDPRPQYLVILLIALGVAALVFLLASGLALNLTRGLRRLDAFAVSLGDEGISRQRAELTGSAEVVSLAGSINRMLDRLYLQHVRLESERQKLLQLANTIPQLAWIAEPDGAVTWYNDRWYAYTGSTPEQMIGWGWQSVNDPAVLPQVLQHWRETLSTGRMMQMTFPLRGADGQYRNFLTSVAPLRDASGRIVQWFGTNTDVTPIEEAERAVRTSEERLQQGLVAARMAVWDWDAADGRVVFSANLQSVFGVAWASMDEAWAQVEPQDAVPLRAAVDRALAEHGEYHATVRIRPPHDSELRWVELRGRVDEAGDTVHVVAIDITERKRAEDALRAADRRKDEFLAMLAHELRNPLAPIASAAELLKLIPSVEPRVKQTSEIIARQIEHMTRLVSDLLDVSRVTRGLVTLSQRRLDLRDIVAEAVEQTQPLIEAKRHSLRIAPPQQPLWVDGDHTRLVQVVTNLLNNAAKYTPEGGEIRIALESADGQAVLRVRDNGAGISGELLPEVFELFAQGQRTLDRSQGGLGLGLALVKRLVELHGGSASATSEGIGHGSEFTIRLPLRAQDAAARTAPSGPAATKAASNDAGTLRILVVDDNVDAADTLALLLEADGYRVAVEYSAQGALRRASEQGFDVLLLDIGLPDMDGYELAHRLKALPQTARSVLMAISGYGQEQDMAKSRAAGFSEHLVKPIDSVRLAGLLARLAKPAADATPMAS